MRIFHILRAHPCVSLVATLALVLVLSIFWQPASKMLLEPFRNHDVPPYPGALNLSHKLPSERGERFATCWARGIERRSHTRMTRFVTSDSPDTVLQFYTAALVDRGPYKMIDREHRAWIEYYATDHWSSEEGERATFEYDTYHDDTTEFAHHVADGYAVVIDAAPEAGRTTVLIVTYEYERLFGGDCAPPP
jgi:hypothetical protein